MISVLMWSSPVLTLTTKFIFLSHLRNLKVGSKILFQPAERDPWKHHKIMRNSH